MKRIILNGDEVRAVLETGRVVVRREVKPQPEHTGIVWRWNPKADAVIATPNDWTQSIAMREYAPIGQPGDKVWGAETWSLESGALDDDDPLDYHLEYKATLDAKPMPSWFKESDGGPMPLCLFDRQMGEWASPVVMPQWASRLTLEIESVRVECGDKWEWVYEMKLNAEQNGGGE